MKTFSSASSCLKTFRQLYRRRSSTFEGGSRRVLFGNHMVPENPIKSHFVMEQISTSASFSKFNNSETIDLYFTIEFFCTVKRMKVGLKERYLLSSYFCSVLADGHLWSFKKYVHRSQIIILWILLLKV